MHRPVHMEQYNGTAVYETSTEQLFTKRQRNSGLRNVNGTAVYETSTEQLFTKRQRNSSLRNVNGTTVYETSTESSQRVTIPYPGFRAGVFFDRFP